MPKLVPKYDVQEFLKFYAEYNFPDEKSKHTADVALSYYLYAYHQMMSFSETCDEFFKKDNPSHDEVISYLRQSWSCAFAMYALLRTCLEALSIMRKMMGDNGQVEDYYKENIARFVDIANDIVKHPTYKHEQASEACEPQALEINGVIDIVTWSDTGTASKQQIDPMADFYLIHNYLEYIARKLMLATN